jgi:hypothetical protein
MEARAMDWLNGVIQGILGTLIYDLLLAAVVAGAIAWLRSKQSRWASPVLYGLGAFTAVLLIAYTFIGHGLLLKQKPETTSENIEDNVKAWTSALGLGTQSVPVADTYFAYKITLANGNAVVVARGSKEKTGYLQFEIGVVPSPEHQAILATLTKDQADVVTQEVTLELARSKIGYTMAGPDAQHLMQAVILMKAVPLANLNEATFAAALDEVDSAVSLIRAAFALSLQHVTTSRVLRK